MCCCCVLIFITTDCFETRKDGWGCSFLEVFCSFLSRSRRKTSQYPEQQKSTNWQWSQQWSRGILCSQTPRGLIHLHAYLVSDCIIYTEPLWRWICLRVPESLVETGSILLHVMSLISFYLLIKNVFSSFYSRLIIIFPFGCDIHGLLVDLKSLPTVSFLLILDSRIIRVNLLIANKWSAILILHFSFISKASYLVKTNVNLVSVYLLDFRRPSIIHYKIKLSR